MKGYGIEKNQRFHRKASGAPQLGSMAWSVSTIAKVVCWTGPHGFGVRGRSLLRSDGKLG